MFYQPSEQEESLLKEAIKSMYPEQIRDGIRYSIRFSKDKGTIYAEVNWGKASSQYELTNQDGKKRWYMRRDWND